MKDRVVKILAAGSWAAVLCVLLFDDQVRVVSVAFCREHRWQAPIFLIMAQMVFASVALPCSPISALAGILWGIGLGFLYSVSATLFASSWTFLLGRYVLRRWVATLELPKPVRAAIGTIERHPWRVVALTYVNPVVPGSSLGYLFGATTISFGNFAAGMLTGTLPLQLLLVILGHGVVNVTITWMNMLLVAAVLSATLLLVRVGFGPGRRLAEALWSAGR